jgi:hypothetical protein
MATIEARPDAAESLGADRNLLATIDSWGNALTDDQCWRTPGNERGGSGGGLPGVSADFTQYDERGSFHKMSLLDDPTHWRTRAMEARDIADQVKNPESRRTMLEIATYYDLLAERAERRKKGSPRSDHGEVIRQKPLISLLAPMRLLRKQ